MSLQVTPWGNKICLVTGVWLVNRGMPYISQFLISKGDRAYKPLNAIIVHLWLTIQEELRSEEKKIMTEEKNWWSPVEERKVSVKLYHFSYNVTVPQTIRHAVMYAYKRCLVLLYKNDWITSLKLVMIN